MNKKTIIQLVIIVVAFGAAGLVLYNGLFQNSPSSQSTASTAQSAPANVLPFGSNLDFSKVLDPNRFQYDQITFPQLDKTNDVGISPDNLIVPAPVPAQPSS